MPGQNIPDKIYPNNTYQTKFNKKIIISIYTGQNITDNMYQTKFTGQNIPDKYTLSVADQLDVGRKTLGLGLWLGLRLELWLGLG